MRATFVGLVVLSLLVTTPARAVVAPDSVAVVANADVPGSVALAMAYAEARDVPSAQVCLLSMPATEEITLAEFTSTVLEPLRTCLGPEVEARIASVVVARGVPIRVLVPDASGHPISITAAIGSWRSTIAGGAPLLGTEPGMTSDCGGTPCYAARVRSPIGFNPFEAGAVITISGIDHRPVLATMLHGRSDADAERLVDVAIDAEAMAPPTGEFLFMRGADSARGALDFGYDAVVAGLSTRGLTDARIVDFDPDFPADRPLAAFFTGTASLGTTIEGNTFVPGALTDNLTSFGAVPENFRATGESQVSIARFVAAGAAGAHGTVAEPLNNCFPSRLLLLDYVDGATLAQAYFGALPYTYWLNLVLGDPMLAPYALRPTVTLDVTDGSAVSTARTITATATAPTGRALASLLLYVDGEEVARSDGAPIVHCLVPTGAPMEILAVARTTWDEAAPRPYPAAGWAAADVTSTAGSTSCEADAGPMPSDAAIAVDAGTTPPPRTGGCGCRAAGSRTSGWGLLFGMAGLGASVARKRRRCRSR